MIFHLISLRSLHTALRKFSQLIHRCALIAITAASLALLSGCVNSARNSTSIQTSNPKVDPVTTGAVELYDSQGALRGSAIFTPQSSKIQVSIRLSQLEPGRYYADIVHHSPTCLHYGDKTSHSQADIPDKAFRASIYDKPTRKGDFPSGELIGIRVGADGAGLTTQLSDEFTLPDLSAGNGTDLEIVRRNVTTVTPTDSTPSHIVISFSPILCGIISSGNSR